MPRAGRSFVAKPLRKMMDGRGLLGDLYRKDYCGQCERLRMAQRALVDELFKRQLELKDLALKVEESGTSVNTGEETLARGSQKSGNRARRNEQMDPKAFDDYLAKTQRLEVEIEEFKQKLRAVNMQQRDHREKMHRDREPFPIQRVEEALASISEDEYDKDEKRLLQFAQPISITRGRSSRQGRLGESSKRHDAKPKKLELVLPSSNRNQWPPKPPHPLMKVCR